MIFMPNSQVKPNSEVVTIPLSIEIVNRYGKPAIQLRKIISDRDVIAILCKRALSDKHIPAKIEFRDKFKAAARLKAANLI